MRLKFLATVLALICLTPNAHAITPVKMERIPIVFSELIRNKNLGNPAMVLVDLKSGQVVFNRDGASARKPASTLKLISALSILDYLPEEQTFSTYIYKTNLKNTFQISGDFDPSITPSARLARSDKFVWSGTLVNKIRVNAKSRSITIRYYGLTSRTRINMSNDFRRVGYRITWRPITLEENNKHITSTISTHTSPNLAKILEHTLLWSDNFVADYVARLAAKEAGYGFGETGIDPVFHDVLARHLINNPVMQVTDGSGLSHKNKVSAMTLAQVLLKIHADPKYKTLIDGLPVSGISGTLQNRFITTSPHSVGLIKAKTGSLSGVVSLAGFIESADHEYAFVILADRVGRYYAAESAARSTIDRILGRLAAPLVPTFTTPSNLDGDSGNENLESIQS
ncbi:MAG: D-alanyl-D-alanine carboxypeptidase [Candidatus Nanopelagicaceae bacterium]